MKTLNPEKKLSEFFDCLKKSQSRILLLDYDGTLAPFRVERDKALPYPGVAEALKQGMGGLKGHRSVGGCRASIYNPTGLDALESLTDFMKDFATKNG